MKTLYISLMALMLAASGYAQDTATDTTRIKVGNVTIIVEGDEDDDDNNTTNSTTEEQDTLGDIETTLFGLDLGMNLMLQNGTTTFGSKYNPIENRIGKSMHVGLHFLPTRINLVKHVVNLKTGLTLDVMNYRFDNKTVMLPRTDSVAVYFDSTGFQKSKLTATYLQIPLLLQFDTNPEEEERSFRFAFGGYGGLLIGSQTKLVTNTDEKIKTEDDFNLNKIRYGVTARIGYGGFDLYVNYQLSELFSSKKDPGFTALTFGVNLLDF